MTSQAASWLDCASPLQQFKMFIFLHLILQKLHMIDSYQSKGIFDTVFIQLHVNK